jgi:hypothetical protein
MVCVTRGLARLKAIRAPEFKILNKTLSVIAGMAMVNENGAISLRDVRVTMLTDENCKAYFAGLGTQVMASVDSGKLVAHRREILLEIAAVEAARKIQAAEDAVSLKSAVEEAKAQQQIVTRTETIVKEVPKYVPVASKCPVTVGFIRVLDAAVLGVSPADLPLPAGKSNDSCADIDAPAVATRIIANYSGVCEANARQLTSLQEWVRKIGEASRTGFK